MILAPSVASRGVDEEEREEIRRASQKLDIDAWRGLNSSEIELLRRALAQKPQEILPE